MTLVKSAPKKCLPKSPFFKDLEFSIGKIVFLAKTLREYFSLNLIFDNRLMLFSESDVCVSFCLMFNISKRLILYAVPEVIRKN
jgi:hypothetical protein